MVTKVLAASISGIDCNIVNVEVDVSTGLPSIDLIGLVGTEVKEAKERVKVALRNNSISLPPARITINLSPANIRKEGTGYDLAIAVGLMAGLGLIKENDISNVLFAGELGLNGEVKGIAGILPMAVEALNKGITTMVVPKSNQKEAASIGGIKVIGLEHIGTVIEYFNALPQLRDSIIKPCKIDVKDIFEKQKYEFGIDYSDLKGQESLKRGMVVAAAGFHNVLMIGPPGAGKTMAAKRLPTILPALTIDESLDVSKIYSVSGLLTDNEGMVYRRPFEAPHHTISDTAMAGGGRIPRPGAVSLAHKGVLFLDEAVHFSKKSLEILRQPIEDKILKISRANASYTFPAEFMLVAAINPCPCGNYPDFNNCNCTPEMIRRYLGKLSGPILDRIDICVEATRTTFSDIDSNRASQSSEELRGQVLIATAIQEERYKNENIRFNSQLGPSDVEKYIELGNKERKLLESAFERMKMSIRGYHRVLKVARTIADLEESRLISTKHIMEAICYRSVEDKYFN